METVGISGTLAEGSSREARSPETQTLEAPAKTLDPFAASVIGGGEVFRVSELGFSSEAPPAGAPDVGVKGTDVGAAAAETVMLDSEISRDSRSVEVVETLLVESRSHTSTEVVEEVEQGFPPNGSEASENGKPEESDVLGRGNLGTWMKEGDGGRGEGEEMVGGVAENPFMVGDFVWGKIKSHPWWPGQVYHSSDASECAKKVYRKDQHCVLVAYFGDGTFAWCDQSQLKRFEENFEQMIRQSSVKSFIGAVKEALDEIGRCLELELTCLCAPAETRARLGRPIAANAGIQGGVTVPVGRIGELFATKYVPSELLELLHDIACDVSIASMLDVSMVWSWFSAFNHGMQWCPQLPVTPQNQVIGDLVDGDIRVCTNASLGGLGLPSSTTGSGVAKVPEILEDKSFQRKKQRSMVELIAEMDMGMEEDGGDEKEEVVIVDKLASSIHSRKRKGVEKSPDAENGVAGGEEGIGSGRRERKKSKYLSPPYTIISGYSKRSISPNDAEMMWPKKDLEASQDGESAGKMGSPFHSSPQILKCSDEATQDKKAFTFEDGSASVDEMLSEFRSAALSPLYLRRKRSSPTVRGFFGRFRSSVYTNGSDFESYKRYLDSMHGIKGKTPCHKSSDVKSKSAGRETNGSQENKSGASVKRKTPSHESNGSEEGKSGSGYKRKSLGHETNGPEGAKSKGTRKSVARETSGSEGKPGQKRKKKKDEANGDTGAALLLTFAPGIPLPSKEELISTFTKFGVLCESETELLKDSGCARVVFAKSSDAEKAFNSSDRNRAFGPAVTNYRLRYLHGNLNTSPPPPPPPPPISKPPLQFVRKSLERMISSLSQSSPPGKYAASSDGLKPEARENLVDEMDGLLKKVNKLLSGSATATTITTTTNIT